jgi:hypothetical protein
LLKQTAQSTGSLDLGLTVKKNTIAIGRYPEVALVSAEQLITGALELLTSAITQLKIEKPLKLLKLACLPIVLKWLRVNGQLIISSVNQNHAKSAHSGD